MKKQGSTDFLAENRLILRGKWSMMIATADKYGCRTLPMRNWHFQYNQSSPQLCIFFVGHYLWGIDTDLRITFLFSMRRISSDITYEELTRAIISLKYYITNFHMHSRTLPMRNWHELLSPFIPSSTKKLFRRTLPMRNWHYTQLIHLLHEESEVGHYLWGIDTHCIQWSLC